MTENSGRVIGSWRGWTQLDNHEPYRSGAVLTATIHAADPETGRPETVRLATGGQIRDADRAVYLLDDGQTIRPHYVAGWHGTTITADVLYLHPFPTSTGTRPDNGRPVDMSGWHLGPRKAYHVKISDVTRES